MTRRIALIAFASAALLLAGPVACNTVRGAGKAVADITEGIARDGEAAVDAVDDGD